ncbi:MAG: hypothetical protein WCH62_01230 [Candidatus Omnitrophota bacterium]
MSHGSSQRGGQFPYYDHCALCIFLFALIVYFQTFFFDFVFDDHVFVVFNIPIRSLNHVVDFFSTGFPLNRLVTLWSFALNYKIYGLNPGAFHFINFFIHLLCTFSIWWLTRLILLWIPIYRGDKLGVDQQLRLSWVAFIVALVFCVHPVQTRWSALIRKDFLL